MLKNRRQFTTPLPNEVMQRSRNTDKRSDKSLFKSIIGSLLYIANRSRPDIAFAVNRLAQFSEDPSILHMKNAYRVLNYLYNSADLVLHFVAEGQKSELPLVAISDSDFAGDPDNSNSTTGTVVKYCGNLVMWRAVKQESPAIHSTESELYAATMCYMDCKFVCKLLDEILPTEKRTPLPLYCDNKSTVEAIVEDKFDKRLRHVDSKWNALVHHQKKKEVEMRHIPGLDNPADILTKALSGDDHKRKVRLMNLHTLN